MEEENNKINDRLSVVIEDRRFVISGNECDGNHTDSVQHEISSIHDMLRAVKEESLDSFLIDLRQFFVQHYRFEEQGLSPQLTSFVWIDDGKHHMDTTLRVDCSELTVDERAILHEALTPKW